MKTKHEIKYKASPYGYIATIPKGTKAIKADNIPGESYWAESWSDMTEKAESWQRNYGFRLLPDEVEE